MGTIKEKIDALISVIELTEHKVGLDTLKEIKAELDAKETHSIVTPYDD